MRRLFPAISLARSGKRISPSSLWTLPTRCSQIRPLDSSCMCETLRAIEAMTDMSVALSHWSFVLGPTPSSLRNRTTGTSASSVLILAATTFLELKANESIIFRIRNQPLELTADMATTIESSCLEKSQSETIISMKAVGRSAARSSCQDFGYAGLCGEF